MQRYLIFLAGVAACGARGEPPPRTLPPADAGVLQLADSMVLSLGNGATVWMTEGRRGTDSAGTGCVERTLEIRRRDGRLKVPLLYTRLPPVRIDDSTFRAELYRNCAPMGLYRISVKDGMPYKVAQ